MRTLHLDGEWSLRQARRTGPIKAIVPSTVHTDLISDRNIPDPYYRNNEDSLLDTLAAIKIKWREIARTDNLFRTYEFDVEPALKKGANTIEVRFDSTIPYIRRRQAKHSLPCEAVPIRSAAVTG